MSCVLLEGAAEFRIRSGLVFVSARDSDGSEHSICVPIADFRKNMAKANRIIAEFDAGKRVIKMGREDHAAS